MVAQLPCPQCGSVDLLFSSRRGEYLCEECGHVFQRMAEAAGRAAADPQQRVFISYGRADALEFVKRLARDLKQRGSHEIWFDLENIEKGGLFEVRIEQGIRRATVVTAVMTRASLRRNSVCRDEVVFALNEGKTIVPLRLDPDPHLKPTLLLARRNWIDFTDGYDSGLDALLKYLEGDVAALRAPELPTITGIAPLDFSVEMAKYSAGFTGREWLRERVENWLGAGTQPGLILIGDPGVGKSAVAAWLCTTCENVVGIHFCTRQNTRSRSAQEFVASLVSQLHASLAGYSDVLEGRFPAARRTTAADAFRELIVEPTRDLHAPAGRLLVVIDSLEEAVVEPGETIPDVLANQIQDLPAWLRLIATTRPEEPILRRFRNLERVQLHADGVENRDDVRRFITARLPATVVADDRGGRAETLVDRIDRAARGNFLYARLTIEALEQGDLDPERIEQLAPGLAVFYCELFSRRFSDLAEYDDQYAPILRALCAAFDPLPRQLLQKLLEYPSEKLHRRLLRLGSLLHVAQEAESSRAALFHRSLRDWLTDPDAAGEYWSDETSGHDQLAGLLLEEWKSHEYGLRYLPAHLMCAKRWDELADVLTNLSFLASKAAAGMVFDLARDFIRAAEALPADHGRRELVVLLGNALRRDIHFIARHPSTLFQCLWNTCWWYDSPEAAPHYESSHADPAEARLPGHREGPRLFELLERWRVDKRAAPGEHVWLRSLRPPLIPLDMVQDLCALGHQGGVSCVAVSPDGERVLSGGGDKTVRLWDAHTGEPAATLFGHAGNVSGVAFSRDGRRIASVAGDHTIRIWDAGTGTMIACHRSASQDFICVAWSHDNQSVLAGTAAGSIRLWRIKEEDDWQDYQGHRDTVWCLAGSWSSRRLASGSADSTVRLWDLNEHRELACFDDHRGGIWSVAMSHDGRWLVSADADRKIRIWETGSQQLTDSLDSRSLDDGAVVCVACSADASRVVLGTDDGALWIWRPLVDQALWRLARHEALVSSLAWSPDGQFVVSGSWDNTVRVWRTTVTGAAPLRLVGGEDRVRRVAFSPDGRRLASAASRAVVRIFDAGNGQPMVRATGTADRVKNLGFSGDSSLVVLDGLKAKQVWDAGSGARLPVIPGLNDQLLVGTAGNRGPWRIAPGQNETVIQSADSGEHRAWWPLVADRPTAHPAGHVCAGVAHHQMFLFCIERERGAAS